MQRFNHIGMRFLVLTVWFGTLFFARTAPAATVDPEVYAQLNEQQEARVIVVLADAVQAAAAKESLAATKKKVKDKQDKVLTTLSTEKIRHGAPGAGGGKPGRCQDSSR
ncbi:hypothetical protein ACFL43_07365 [Thermodesulfobacteriota bacterium]